MTARFAGTFLAVVLAAPLALAQQGEKKQIDLPSSKFVQQPITGAPQRTNSFPTAIALSPDGKQLAILNNGRGTPESNYDQSIAILELATNQLRDFPDPRLQVSARQTYFVGLAWSSDGKEIYASVASLTDPEGKSVDDKGRKLGGIGNGIAVYKCINGALNADRFLTLPPAPIQKGKKITYGRKSVAPGTAISYPAGLSVVKSANGDALLVAENLADDALLINPRDGKVLQRFDLSSGKYIPANFPYSAITTRNGNYGWVSLWNGSGVAKLDLHAGRVARQIALKPPQRPAESSSHPTAMLLSPDERWLYVALANRDQVAVIDANTGEVERYLDTRLPGQKYGGNYPQALAQPADGSRLYVADASSDAIAVFDLRHTSGGHATALADRATYFIPTEWYPTSIAVQGGDLFIATGKGVGTGPNSAWNGPEHGGKKSHMYIPSMIRGSIARVNLAGTEKDQGTLTAEVVRSNRMDGRTGEITFQRGSNPIHHVIYIIKENRTYDQIFGDIKEANGDPSLVMYGEEITPNEHALVRQFGILDNFYDSGEVSGNGHPWSTAAIETDYGERAWQIAYRGKEREYDSEGTLGNIIPLNYDIPDANEPATGYLWGNLARHNLTYRHYGEYIETFWCIDTEQEYSPSANGAPTGHPENCALAQVKPGENLPVELGGGKSPYQFAIPLPSYNVATKPELREHFDPRYPDFKVEYPDQFRADEFLREFARFVEAKKGGKGTELPNFCLVRLPNDHTAGTKPGSPTPNASVADNDLAVGRVAEVVSNSPYWEDTAIFVLEDDAQNGADHVDAHRSTALVISKYSPRQTQPFVDHNFYTTVNMIHTMETLLGLPTMNNNDAFAAVMAPLFSGAGDQPPFKADYRNRDNGMMYQANAPAAPMARESSKLDFSVADAADSEKLNAILWRAAKGNVPMPASRHTVIPASCVGTVATERKTNE
jgi:DNA-binding beta-propeller fold protein YncE